jgi:serine/threonine protein kinase
MEIGDNPPVRSQEVDFKNDQDVFDSLKKVKTTDATASQRPSGVSGELWSRITGPGVPPSEESTDTALFFIGQGRSCSVVRLLIFVPLNANLVDSPSQQPANPADDVCSLNTTQALYIRPPPCPPNTTVRLIGQGRSGSVYQLSTVDPQTGQRNSTAVKVFRPELIADHQKEVGILDHLKRELPSFYYRNFFEIGHHRGIVFDTLGPSLGHYLRRHYPHGMPPLLVTKYLSAISGELRRIHRAGYAHCDLKPDNIASDIRRVDMSRCVVPIDYGNASRIGKRLRAPPIVAYRPPEVAPGIVASPAVDVWSMGCLAIEMLIGRQLFDSDGFRPEKLTNKGVAATVSSALRHKKWGKQGKEVSELELLALRMLQVDPRARASVVEVLDALRTMDHRA